MTPARMPAFTPSKPIGRWTVRSAPASFLPPCWGGTRRRRVARCRSRCGLAWLKREVKMRIALRDDILSITEVDNLVATNSELFRDRVQAEWPHCSLSAVEIDLSRTQFLDSCGLGALLAVHKWAVNH